MKNELPKLKIGLVLWCKVDLHVYEPHKEGSSTLERGDKTEVLSVSEADFICTAKRDGEDTTIKVPVEFYDSYFSVDLIEKVVPTVEEVYDPPRLRTMESKGLVELKNCFVEGCGIHHKFESVLVRKKELAFLPNVSPAEKITFEGTFDVTEPPLGVIPEYIHKEKRLKDILQAKERYSTAGVFWPVRHIEEEIALTKWLEEYNLNKGLAAEKIAPEEFPNGPITPTEEYNQKVIVDYFASLGVPDGLIIGDEVDCVDGGGQKMSGVILVGLTRDGSSTPFVCESGSVIFYCRSISRPKKQPVEKSAREIATEMLKKHWEERVGKPFGEMEEACLGYAIDAIEEALTLKTKTND